MISHDGAALLRPVTGKVAILEEAPGFAVVAPDGTEFAPARTRLMHLESEGCPRTTRRSYANSLARYLYYVWEAGLSWRSDVDETFRSFMDWAASDRRGGRTYSESTVKHTANAVKKFYDYAVPEGSRPSSPRDRVAGLQGGRRKRRRSMTWTGTPRRPRALAPHDVQQYFWTLGSNRDRALVSLWVCTPLQAGELLALTIELVDFEHQSVGAVREGVVQRHPVPRSALVG